MTVQVTFNFIGGTAATLRVEEDPAVLARSYEAAIENEETIKHQEGDTTQVFNLSNVNVVTIRKV